MRCERSLWCALAGVVACTTLSAIAHADQTIYRCELGGVSTFSDQPCGADVATYEPNGERVSTYDPPPTPKTRTQPLKTQRRNQAASSIAAAQAEHARECLKIQEGLADIRSAMRAGYNARQGEKLRERKAKLERRRQAEKCRR